MFALTDGRKDGWTDGRMNGPRMRGMEGRIDRRMDEGGTDGKKDARRMCENGGRDGRMDSSRVGGDKWGWRE